jgi:hypothetical protein
LIQARHHPISVTFTFHQAAVNNRPVTRPGISGVSIALEIRRSCVLFYLRYSCRVSFTTKFSYIGNFTLSVNTKSIYFVPSVRNRFRVGR